MINICILDDEEELTEQLYAILEDYLLLHDIPYKIDVYQNSSSLLNAFLHSNIRYQIYLLDIVMQGKNGIQVAREIRAKDSSVPIIFLTSSSEYALEGYEVHAYGYLLKPLHKEKLSALLSELFYTPEPMSSKKLQITHNGTVRNISYQHIVYIEVQRNKLILILNTGEKIETYSTITEMDTLLKEELFFTRTHRSFIINMMYIKEITSTNIRLQPDYYIPVSRTYSASVKQDYFTFAKGHFV